MNRTSDPLFSSPQCFWLSYGARPIDIVKILQKGSILWCLNRFPNDKTFPLSKFKALNFADNKFIVAIIMTSLS